MSNRINYNSIPSDYASRFRLDGNGNNDIGSNNAIVTNAIWSNSDKHYQLKNLNWGATTSFTYTAITYTNSYVFINGVYTKNSPQVTSTALNGVSGSTYSGLIFYNRTLSTSEEQAIKLEGDRRFGDKPNYPQLLRGLKAYYDFKGGSLSNLVDGTNATNNGATLTIDHLGRANNAYSFNGTSEILLENFYTSLGNNPSFSINYTFQYKTGNTIWNRYFGNYISTEVSFDFSYYSATQSHFYAVDNNSNVAISHIINTNFVNNQYYTVTISRVPNKLDFYIDGVLQFTDTTTQIGGYDSGKPISLGSIGGGNYGISCVNSFLLFNRGLNSSEVKELYNLTSKEYIYPFSKSSILSLQKGLVMHLDSNGNDLSGNGNNGTPTAVTPTRRGQSEGGIYNGSTSEIVNIPFNGLPTTASEITISFGAIPKNNTVQTTIINTSINTANWINIHLPWTNNIIYWDFGNITNGRLSTAFDITWLNQLAHWVFVSGPNGMQIYRNNKLLATQVSSASYSKGAEVMYLGKYTATGTHWTGNIYSPKIRNRALTPKEVEMEYYLNYIN